MKVSEMNLSELLELKKTLTQIFEQNAGTFSSDYGNEFQGVGLRKNLQEKNQLVDKAILMWTQNNLSQIEP